MDGQADIERLATKVMGWHKGNYAYLWGWVDAQVCLRADKDWNPWKSWHDAGMVADELAKRYRFMLRTESQGWSGHIYDSDDPADAFHAHADSGPAAIAEAALKVYNG